MDNSECRRYIEKGDIKILLMNDQLYSARKSGHAILSKYIEYPLNFYPTYKYDPGTDVYDTSKKMRTPAWCDRVLYYEKEKDSITPSYYNRIENRFSDHRPVVFICEVKCK